MAHFAQINENNVVQQVIVINNDLLNDNGVEQESKGQEFCQKLLGGTWIQTSYNKNFRKNFGSVGYTYNSTLDAFLPPQPYSSWTLNTSTFQWQPPTPMPEDNRQYVWNETTQAWTLV